MNSSDGWQFSSTPLTWPSTSGYTLYPGGDANWTQLGSPKQFSFTTLPTTATTSFFIEGTGFTDFYFGMQGGISSSSNIGPVAFSSPFFAIPNKTVYACNASNGSPAGPINLYTPGNTLSDGDVQNLYTLVDNDGAKHYVKFAFFTGGTGAATTPYSFLINMYRDNSFQWFECMAKTNAKASPALCGPYDSLSVGQLNSTTSQVWRGNLTGTSWTYMGTGSVV